MNRIRFFYGIIIVLAGLSLSSFIPEKQGIKYMQVATIESSVADEPFLLQTYKDTATNESILLQKTKDKIPLYYFKKIKGEVCLTKECRRLDMLVYWNITGRYLGFELPKGEFLSKYNHEPFTEKEYQQLHELLADESLPLDNVSYEKLLAKPQKKLEKVDGYSGATSKDISKMVVKGAAFTTYKLWNTVNGPTMDLVSQLTENQLSSSLLHRILQSQDITDKLWAIHRMDAVERLTLELQTTLLELISSDDFYLSYTALKAINSTHLNNSELQIRLFSIYQNANQSISTAILKKLMEAPFLSSQIIETSSVLLPQLNGQQLAMLLQLYTKHNITDAAIYRAVVKMLSNENKFISKKAYAFLMGRPIKDKEIIDLLNAYKKEK